MLSNYVVQLGSSNLKLDMEKTDVTKRISSV